MKHPLYLLGGALLSCASLFALPASVTSWSAVATTGIVEDDSLSRCEQSVFDLKVASGQSGTVRAVFPVTPFDTGNWAYLQGRLYDPGSGKVRLKLYEVDRYSHSIIKRLELDSDSPQIGFPVTGWSSQWQWQQDYSWDFDFDEKSYIVVAYLTRTSGGSTPVLRDVSVGSIGH